MVKILLVLLMGQVAYANCNDLAAPEKKECKKSKTEERQCKAAIKKGVTDILGKTVAKKDAGKVMSDCLKELKDFCGDHAFYKGCKIDASRDTCKVWKMNETRTESEGEKKFPKEMDCMEKYKKYL